METARILMGLIVSILLADSLPIVRRSFLFRIVCTLTFGLWALLPVLPLWKVSLLMVMAIFWSCSLRLWEKNSGLNMQAQAAMQAHNSRLFGIRSYSTKIVKRIGYELRTGKRWLEACVKASQRRSFISAGVLIICTLIVVYLAIGISRLPRLLSDGIASDRVTIAITGLLIATFVCHEAVARVYALVDKTAPKSRTQIFAFNENYAYIGWLERALVFAFIASGQAAAAALAITAKSLARHQKLEEEKKFDERFIIGTIVSVLFAILWAVLVRVSLGLKPM